MALGGGREFHRDQDAFQLGIEFDRDDFADFDAAMPQPVARFDAVPFGKPHDDPRSRGTFRDHHERRRHAQRSEAHHPDGPRPPEPMAERPPGRLNLRDGKFCLAGRRRRRFVGHSPSSQIWYG